MQCNLYSSDKNVRLEKYQVLVRLSVNSTLIYCKPVLTGIDILRGYLALLNKTKMGKHYDPGIPLLGLYLETLKYVHKAIH